MTKNRVFVKYIEKYITENLAKFSVISGDLICFLQNFINPQIKKEVTLNDIKQYIDKFI